MNKELINLIAMPAKVVDTAIDLISQLLNEPANIAGEIISDKLRHWQWQNRISISSKAAKVLKHNKTAVNVMPKGFFLKFLDASGFIEDDELQDLWSRLLADAATSHTQIHPILLNAIQGLGPEDARLLNKVLSSFYRTTRHDEEGVLVRERYGFKIEGDLIVANGLSRLEILGFVRPCPHCLASGSHIYISKSNPKPHGDVTLLGVELHRILGLPAPPSSEDKHGSRLMVSG